MVLVHAQDFYERFTGIKHKITISFGYFYMPIQVYYEVRVDGEFYSNHDSKNQAFDEVEDIIKTNDWSPVRNFWSET